MISIEVAYAEPDRQRVVAIEVEDGTTLIEAIGLSAIGEDFPSLDIASVSKGVFGELKPDNYQVREGDRIEIYRPLKQDPREARRKRASKNN